jgi:recombination protein RecA
VRSFLKANPEMFVRMDAELRAKMGIGAATPAPIPPLPVDGEVRAQEAVRPGRK